MKTNESEDGRLFAPAAGRNRDAIEAVLGRHLPQSGQVLEIASGTGEHISHFAEMFGQLFWQPSDRDDARRESVEAWRNHVGLENLLPQVNVDVAADDWAGELKKFDFVMVVNLLHLISGVDMLSFMRGAAEVLHDGGKFMIYGPFMRGGKLTSDGDAKFHADLQKQDALIGYKDIDSVVKQLGDCGFELVETVEMPANNMAIIVQK